MDENQEGSVSAWYRLVPDDQKISYKVTPRPGALMRARLLGGQLQALADLMLALGDEEKDGLKFETFVADISMDDDGSITFDLAVLPEVPDESDDNG